MRLDILELVAYASSKGLRPVFGTNGTLLTEDMAVQLKKSGATAMGISLDSLDREKHNVFRGGEEAFDRTIRGMENCRRIGLPFQIHTTVMDWNRDEIIDIIDFGVKMGAMAVYLFFLIPVGRGRFIEESALEVESYENLLRAVMNSDQTHLRASVYACGKGTGRNA
jgi:MoaA/NifB/PqqE/SkfB family radical SAM enzyme